MRFKLLVVFIVLTISAVNHGQMLQQIGIGQPFVPKISFGLLKHRHITETTQSGSKIKTTDSGNSTMEMATTMESITATTTPATNLNQNTTTNTPENAE